MISAPSLLDRLGQVPPPNKFRGSDVDRGHVESYFLRANDPHRPRALWLKATVLIPNRGPAVAESWCAWFDGETNRTFAHRLTEPLHPEFARCSGARAELKVCGASWLLDASGHCRGGMAGTTWDLEFERLPGSLGEPLCFFPTPAMLLTPIPKSKAVSPLPALTFRGHIDVFGERIDVDGWEGLQGHNWGREHAFEYAWGQCFFPATADGPAAWMEGFTARIKIGPTLTPRLSSVVIQRGDASWRFDRLLDPWNQRADLGDRTWTLALRNDDARMQLHMDAQDRPMVCLGYRNPDGMLSYCLNSKLARTRVVVEPRNGPAFTLESPHGGALEFLRRDPPGGLAVV